MDTRSRIEKLRREFSDLEVDGFLVSSPDNRLYLSGFTGSNGQLLITASEAALVTDFRYVEQAGSESPSFRVHQTQRGTPWLPGLVAELGIRTLGFEADDMTVAAHGTLVEELDEADPPVEASLEPTTGVVEQIRATKSPDELELIERAVAIADLAMETVAAAITPGMTEKQVAELIEFEVKRLGAEGPSFESIVAAGRNGALPHHRAGNTVIEQGDGVVIDMGANYLGYCSDLTRTHLMGEPDERFRPVYGIVLSAQMAAIEGARPGMTGEEIDTIARAVIKDAGYEDEFGHGLGHGVGLAVHERPMVVPTSEDVIEDGMVFTIEPGIYISGWGGVRIEDIVVMENGRARVLTKSPK